MIATLLYHFATSIMLTLQSVLLFTLAKQGQIAQGVDEKLAGLHAVGIVFAIATLTGAMRIPGNYFAGWLSHKTEQRNLSGLSAASQSVILGALAILIFCTHRTSVPLATALYAMDWFMGGPEEVGRTTLPMVLVENKSAEFKSWSTMSQFLAELCGLFGPMFVVTLTLLKGKGLDMAGHAVVPVLYLLCAILYFSLPRDLHHKALPGKSQTQIGRIEKWRVLFRDPALALPVIALALLSTTLLKGPLSLNMASLLLGKEKIELTMYTALLSGIFGAGLGVGSWMAHRHDVTRSWHRHPAAWLAISALGTMALVFSWISGYWPAVSFAVLAVAWFSFATTNAVCRLLMIHLLQKHIAAAGPDKKYVMGHAFAFSNLVITVLRVLAGLIFFVVAKTWQMAFSLFGGVLILVALGQWLVSHRLAASEKPA